MQTNYTPEKDNVVFGLDSAVIRKYISGIPGGRTLDVTDYAEDVIKAGHVIIKLANGNYAPMPIIPAQDAKPAEGESPAVEARVAKYAALPSGATYVGVLYRSISKKLPEAAIMYDGVVNPTLTPYAMDDIKDAFKAACPQIIFEEDEIA